MPPDVVAPVAEPDIGRGGREVGLKGEGVPRDEGIPGESDGIPPGAGASPAAENHGAPTGKPRGEIAPVQEIEPGQRIESLDRGRFPLLPVDPPEFHPHFLERVVQQLEIRLHEARVGAIEGNGLLLRRVRPQRGAEPRVAVLVRSHAGGGVEVHGDADALVPQLCECGDRIRKKCSVPAVAGPSRLVPVHVDHQDIEGNIAPIVVADDLFDVPVGEFPEPGKPQAQRIPGRHGLLAEKAGHGPQSAIKIRPIRREVEVLVHPLPPGGHPGFPRRIAGGKRDGIGVVKDRVAAARDIAGKKRLDPFSGRHLAAPGIAVEPGIPLRAVHQVQRSQRAGQDAGILLPEAPSSRPGRAVEVDAQVFRGKSAVPHPMPQRHLGGADGDLPVRLGDFERGFHPPAFSHRDRGTIEESPAFGMLGTKQIRGEDGEADPMADHEWWGVFQGFARAAPVNFGHPAQLNLLAPPVAPAR